MNHSTTKTFWEETHFLSRSFTTSLFAHTSASVWIPVDRRCKRILTVIHACLFGDINVPTKVGKTTEIPNCDLIATTISIIIGDVHPYSSRIRKVWIMVNVNSIYFKPCEAWSL